MSVQGEMYIGLRYQDVCCSVTCVNYRRGGLVPNQEETALAFMSHSCTQGVYLSNVTVVLRTKTEVIDCSITSPHENTRSLH